MQPIAAKEQNRPVRVSTGSALTLGLENGFQDVRPTTVYLLTHHLDRCSANCLFCPQARTSRSRPEFLSRVSWPVFRLGEVLDALTREEERLRRVCIQAVNYTGVIDDVLAIVSKVLSRIDIDVSVSCQPVDSESLDELRDVGVDRLGIPLDAAAPGLFTQLKGQAAGGPYTWRSHMNAIHEAISVFGKGRVTTHVIVGLGETDRDLLRLIQRMVSLGVNPALFAFTPVAGTRLENMPPPSLSRYRLIQTARFLLVNRLARVEKMRFDASEALVDFGLPKEQLRRAIRSGLPYLTSGCPGCNRPFYNERPSGPIYNFPRPMTPPEVEETERTVEGACYG